MFRTLLSKQSIFVLTVCFSLFTTGVVAVFSSNFLVLLFVFVAPLMYSGLQVRHTEQAYDTPKEEHFARNDAMVFWKFLTGGVILLSVVAMTTDGLLVFISGLLLLGSSTVPMRAIHYWLYRPYNSIEFGFREVLPASQYWMGMFVLLWNAQRAQYTYTQQIWYWFAAKRADKLLERLPSSSPYAKRQVANQYRTALYDHSQTGNQVNTRSTFERLLKNLSQLVCQKCYQEKPVGDLYLLTDGGVLTEAYCIECLHHQKDRAGAESSSTASSRQTVTETPTDELQHALEVFNFAKDTTTLSEEQLETRYRELVKETHPDTGGSSKAFTEVKNAYDTLQEYYT